jgi:hypothetical protein
MALLFAACCVTPPAVAESVEARAARYYAEGLGRPLQQLREGAMLIQACRGRLRGGCDKAQIRKAGDDHVLALLDALTLFPPRLDIDPLASTSKPQQLREQIRATRAELLLSAGQYDLALFARYGATLLSCPPEGSIEAYLISLNDLRLLDLTTFQGLSAEDAVIANSANIETSSHEAAKWRDRPAEDCIAARGLGDHLMQLMTAKLQPWSAPGNTGPREFDFDHPRSDDASPAEAAPSRDLATAVAGNFISVVATDLQLRVFPQTAPQIKELADRAGFPSQD